MRSPNIPQRFGVLALATALFAALPGCEWLSSAEEVDSAKEQPRTIYALGQLEPATGVIDIRATPGDRLKKFINVVEDKIAPEDGVLGLLSSYDMGRAQLTALLKKRELVLQKHVQQIQLAEAQFAQAIASQAQTQVKLTELTLQQGKLEALRVARGLAEGEYFRLEQLRAADPELVTGHQLDKQKNRMDLASADYQIARETHASATTATKLAVSAAEANVSVAKITKQQAAKNFEKLVVDQEIEVAREVLKRSILVAPHESPIAMRKLLLVDANDDLQATQEPHEKPQYTVLKVHLRLGEVVTQGPILQLGDLRKMVCIAEVHESDVQELWVGQTVTVRSPAFSGPFADGPLDPPSKKGPGKERSGGLRGHVVRIGRMIVSPGLSNRNPLAPADRSIVEVRIEIDREPETAVLHASRHVGLQVTVEFDKAKSGKPDA
ncbi:MAG: hypothetical protein GXP28_11200 [Planctomycetes bacterium]|nr:hypothetical protein [Planctomycetota bacterium]